MAIAVERQTLTRSQALRRSLFSRDRLIQIGLIVVILAVWEFVGQREGDFFLAPPSSVLQTLGEEITTPEFWSLVRETCTGILIGFVIAAVAGVIIGLLMGTYRAVATALNPIVSAGYVIPEA